MCASLAPAPLEIRLAPDCDAALVQASFRGTLIASRCLRPGPRKGGRFVIGAAKGADAPAGEEWLGKAKHTLVRTEGRGFVVALADGMTGRMVTPDRAVAIAELALDHGAPFTAPAGATFELTCGAVAFVVAATVPPPVVPRPAILRRGLGGPGATAVLATLVFVALMAFVPRDPKALSFDLLIATHRFMPVTILAAKKPLPAGDRAPLPGAPGDAHLPNRSESSTAPRPRSPARSAARPHGDDPETLGRTGILGILSSTEGQSWRSIFSADSSLSASATEALRGLQAVGGTTAASDGLPVGVGPGPSGPGLVGHGPQGLGMMSGCDAHCRAAGHLGPRMRSELGSKDQHDLDFSSPPVVVRGVLDREIVRRVIRRHVNEIRYCYERELPRHPELAGRIVVTFTIAPQGRVMAAAKESSTMNDAAVEACVVQAVKRWEFPQPKDNGVVIVSYPFVFAPAGS